MHSVDRRGGVAQGAQPLQQQRWGGAVLGLALLDFASLLRDVQVKRPAPPERLLGDVADPIRRQARTLCGAAPTATCRESASRFLRYSSAEPSMKRFWRGFSGTRIRSARTPPVAARCAAGFPCGASDGEIELIGIGVRLSEASRCR